MQIALPTHPTMTVQSIVVLVSEYSTTHLELTLASDQNENFLTFIPNNERPKSHAD